jgi:hypothetical protein
LQLRGIKTKKGARQRILKLLMKIRRHGAAIRKIQNQVSDLCDLKIAIEKKWNLPVSSPWTIQDTDSDDE